MHLLKGLKKRKKNKEALLVILMFTKIRTGGNEALLRPPRRGRACPRWEWGGHKLGTQASPKYIQLG